MATNDPISALDKALEQVSGNRRGFLKRVLGGAAALGAVPLITSEAAAQETEGGGKGKGKGGGKGKGRGKGKGKGGGKGKGKGKGANPDPQ